MKKIIATTLLIFTNITNTNQNQAKIYFGYINNRHYIATLKIDFPENKDLEIKIKTARLALFILSKTLLPDVKKRITEEMNKSNKTKLELERKALEAQQKKLRRLICNGNTVLKAFGHKHR